MEVESNTIEVKPTKQTIFPKSFYAEKSEVRRFCGFVFKASDNYDKRRKLYKDGHILATRIF